MKNLKLKKGSVMLYDSIDELPVTLYWKAKELWAIENEMPTKPAEVASFYSEIISFLDKAMYKEARTKLVNLLQGHVALSNGTDHTSLVFSVFVHSINGKTCKAEDSQEMLKERLESLVEMGLTWGQVKETVIDLKKKLIANLD